MKYIILSALAALFIFISYKSKQFYNPYRLTMIFGKKGSGKTTLLTKLSIKYNKMGYKVFSNVEIFGTNKLDISDIGVNDFPPKSVLLIDEVSLIWDNRNFKSFKPEVARYFRLQRHYKNVVYLFSQNFDVDKKIRDLCDDMYLLTNIFCFISVARKIRKTPTLHQPDQDGSGETKGEGFITEDFSFDFPTSWIFTYIPRYIKFFNSFEIDSNEPVKRNRYKFNNEPYLYKLTYYKNYKLDQMRDSYDAVIQWLHEFNHSFKVSEAEFHFLEISEIIQL